MQQGITQRRTWRDAWVEIRPSSLIANAAALASLRSPESNLMPVVKADAYGHGASLAVSALMEAGFSTFCVATVAEAVAVRRLDSHIRIVCLYEPPAQAWAAAITAGIEVTIGSVEGLAIAVSLPHSGARAARFQIALDTGMTRQGLRYDRLASSRSSLRRLSGQVTGVWTHLADGADPASATRQLERFDAAMAELRLWGTDAPRHAAASAAILAGHGLAYEAARPGLALYGAIPAEFTDQGEALPVALEPAMAVRARPLRVESVPGRTAVGYGGTFVTRRRSRLATLPLGYADGLPRAYGNGVGSAIVRGQRVPIVGRISMDSCVVDVSDVPSVTRQAVFTILGRAGRERITLEEVARLSGTIPQEVAVRIGARLARRQRR